MNKKQLTAYQNLRNHVNAVGRLNDFFENEALNSRLTPDEMMELIDAYDALEFGADEMSIFLFGYVIKRRNNNE